MLLKRRESFILQIRTYQCSFAHVVWYNGLNKVATERLAGGALDLHYFRPHGSNLKLDRHVWQYKYPGSHQRSGSVYIELVTTPCEASGRDESWWLDIDLTHAVLQKRWWTPLLLTHHMVGLTVVSKGSANGLWIFFHGNNFFLLCWKAIFARRNQSKAKAFEPLFSHASTNVFHLFSLLYTLLTFTLCLPFPPPVSSFGLAMDQQHDLLSSSPNSHTAHYNSGDTMATSLSGMTINDHHHGNQFHKENGIAVGLVRPGDCPMKGELTPVGKQVGCVTASQNKYTLTD